MLTKGSILFLTPVFIVRKVPMLILLPGFSIHFLDDLRIPDIPSTPLEQEEPK